MEHGLQFAINFGSGQDGFNLAFVVILYLYFQFCISFGAGPATNSLPFGNADRWQPFMRTLLILILTMFGCGQNKSHIETATSDYYTNNEDKFGFLVFGKGAVDSFFKMYSPIEPQNEQLQIDFNKLSKNNNTGFTENNSKYFKHSYQPKLSDYNHASTILMATKEKGGERYFPGSVTYLFFFKSLPEEFKNKWAQTTLGAFEFNVTFFNLLRVKCKTFNDHIYGNVGNWDKDILKIFRHDIINEITAENAQVIKNCIIEDTVFRDERLKLDKENFIFFLDQVVLNNWRLFLMDRN